MDLPVLCFPLGSAQLLQQFLVLLVDGQHAAEEVETIRNNTQVREEALYAQETYVDLWPLYRVAVVLCELQASLWEEDLGVWGEGSGQGSRHTLLHRLGRGVARHLQLQQVQVQLVVILRETENIKHQSYFVTLVLPSCFFYSWRYKCDSDHFTCKVLHFQPLPFKVDMEYKKGNG